MSLFLTSPLVDQPSVGSVMANFLFAAVGDDAVADFVKGSPCKHCGLIHVHSSLGPRRMDVEQWRLYRALCGRVIGSEVTQ